MNIYFWSPCIIKNTSECQKNHLNMFWLWLNSIAMIRGGFTMRNSIRNLNLLQYVYFTPKNKQNFDHPVSLMQSILNSSFLYFVEGLLYGFLNLHLFWSAYLSEKNNREFIIPIKMVTFCMFHPVYFLPTLYNNIILHWFCIPVM